MCSSLAKDIFEQDLLCFYEKQTVQRDELRLHSKELIAEIVSRINAGTYDNPKVEELLLCLADRLSKTKGKKVYGYLKADVKALVDAIVDELTADEKIAALYNLWYEQKEEALQVYTETLPQRVPLSQNKEFKPIKNAVIQEALGLHADGRMWRNRLRRMFLIRRCQKLRNQILRRTIPSSQICLPPFALILAEGAGRKIPGGRMNIKRPVPSSMAPRHPNRILSRPWSV